MSGGMQAARGNYNQLTMNNHEASPTNILTQAEAVEVLAQIEQMIRNSQLPEELKEKTAKYMEVAKAEAEDNEPDKQLISKSLEKVTKNLEELDKTMDTSKRVFEKIAPLLIKIAGWLGAAAGSLWVMLP